MRRGKFKRIKVQDAVYFVVFKTKNNFPYFKEEIFCKSIINDLRICKQICGFKLYAFSIIYDHINLFIEPNSKNNI